MRETVIGKYIRLSQADRDLMKKESKTESESISHQRALIQNYIDSDQELKGCRQEEFFDDGYSGTNFDRPSFERLLQKIRSGEINCVIVKDFSRFGRDYIELGDYLERIFPFLGVRFISVNDHYDSNDYKGTTGGLDVVMKNIVYDYYSKDLSMKVKTAKRSKMKRGEYMGGHIPYGLMKDPDRKNRLMPDPEAAEIVKEIFDYALKKAKLKDIVDMLNQKGYETPGAYYRRKHPGSKKFANSSALSCWTMDNVRNILQQGMYYGAVVQHKREGIGIGGKHTRAVPKEEQLIVEGMFEPIVSKETFLNAQKIFRRAAGRKTAVPNIYPLRSHIKCAVCGRRLQYRTNEIHGVYYNYFWCPLSKYQDGSKCYPGYYREDDLNEVVLQGIRKLQNLAGQAAMKASRSKANAADERLSNARTLSDLQKALERCENDKFANVDAMMAGDISKDQYQERRKLLNDQEESLKKQISDAQKQNLDARMEQSEEAADVIDKLRSFEGTEKLTPEMVAALVKEVRVTDPEHIEIRWNFSDEVYRFITEE